MVLYAYCGNDPINRHDPLGLAYPAPGYLHRDSAPAFWLDGLMPATAAELRGGRSPWGGTRGAIAHSRNVTMPLLKTATATGYAITALPLAAPVIMEAPVAVAAANDAALKAYVWMQYSAKARAAAALLGGYHLYNFATDSEYRGQTISIDGGIGFSSVGFAIRDASSECRWLLTHPRLNPRNYDWNPFFAPFRGGYAYSGVPVPGLPKFQVPSPEVYKLSLPTMPTPTGSPANLFEIANTGPLNYQIKGGGVEFWADGIMGTTIQESKFLTNAERSPFILESGIPPALRSKILGDVDSEFERMAKIIADPTNPLMDVEVITNDPRANQFFLDLLKKHGLNGRVINR